MLISFVTTVYNKAPVIERVVDAIVAQKGDFDREYIFVDDGSTDSSLSLLRAMAENTPGMVVVTQENAGPSGALNTAFGLVTGDFIKGQDGDDILHPDATALLLAGLERGQADVIFGQSEPYLADAGMPPSYGQSLRLSDIEVKDDPVWDVLNGRVCNPSGWLARAASVKAAGGCDPAVFVQDVSLPLRLAARSRVAEVPDTVFYFLKPSDDVFHMSNNQRQILHDVTIAQANFMRDYPEYKSRFGWWIAQKAAGRAWHWARRRSGRADWRLFANYLLAKLRIGDPHRRTMRALRAFGDGIRKPAI
ncbi:MAG: glycosyltransferase [Alphaproteobacteria bacterium]|nr:glycosyltransferase [Alphaproteobacteria bacterium]